MDKMKFTCGHESEIPVNMGRGQARNKRIANYFNRSCCDCRCQNEIKLQKSLTMIDGSPRPAEFVAARIELKLKQIRSTY